MDIAEPAGPVLAVGEKRVRLQPFESGIEVNGQTVYAIVDGFMHFKQFPSRVLLEEGIGTAGPDGLVRLQPDAWYSQEAWLRAFERVSASLGAHLLEQIGRRIPENAHFPPWVTDIDSAIRSIDIAYHMNHRKAGRVMYDLETRTMLEGIGHYGYERPDPAQRRILSVCENPYPCDFDRGILLAMARRFESTAYVVHDAQRPCRKRGERSCTYVVSW